MEIKYAIHSSNSNKEYLDFWPVVSEVWHKKFKIIPVLLYIGEDNDNLDSSEYGLIIKIKPIEGISVISQTQIIRFWGTTLFPNDISIISDIDMIPISNSYFIKSIENISKNNYVHLNPYVNGYGRIPICYHVALGRVFKDVLNIEAEWINFLRKVIYEGDEFCKKNNLSNWFLDEIYSTNKINSYDGQYKINLISRPVGIFNRRIDRANWIYSRYLMSTEYYLDAHSVRPYLKYEKEIKKLKEIILKTNIDNFNSKIRNIYLYTFFILYTISKIYLYAERKFIQRRKIK